MTDARARVREAVADDEFADAARVVGGAGWSLARLPGVGYPPLR
ncbi:MAG TPA: hypothetical protein VM939_05720 [Gemmatimonadaceae bacterium]|nr:hypothetical protein [Gemmatimonadaceae bacterium]